MSTICPKDFTACPDDVCRGSGVCLRTNTELMSRCQRCHAVYGDDIECECEPEYDEVEMACRGCFGPCGRCHELGAK